MMRNKIIFFVFLIFIIAVLLPFIFKQTTSIQDTDNLLSYFSSIFAAICTAGLGAVALWQNEPDKTKQENLDIFKNYTNLNNIIPNLSEHISTNIAQESKTYEMNNKLVTSKLAIVEELKKEPKYTNGDMITELKSILDDIKALQNDLYWDLRKSAYDFITQYEIEICK